MAGVLSLRRGYGVCEHTPSRLVIRTRRQPTQGLVRVPDEYDLVQRKSPETADFSRAVEGISLLAFPQTSATLIARTRSFHHHIHTAVTSTRGSAMSTNHKSRIPEILKKYEPQLLT